MSTDGVGHGSTVEGISDLLRCYICMDRLTKATLCPYCSKLGCFECIKRWVTDNRSDCPHCRNPLTMNDLIKIPLFDDLKSVLDSLHSTTSEVVLSKNPDMTCSIHKEKMSVYCETCRECICHKCALWGVHNGHSLKPLDDFYKGHVEVLQGELAKLNEHLKEIVAQVKLVESKMESVKINKSKTKREMSHLVEKKCAQLDELARDRIEQLKKFREHLCTQAVEITKESHDLDKVITAGNVSSLLNRSGDLKADVSARVRQLLSSSQNMESMCSISQFINEVVPEYDHAIFKMSSFRELQRKGKEIYSEPLKLQGLVWRLKVYPNGHKEEIGNYLAVFVELSEGYSRVARYQYCIEMMYGCSSRFPQRNYKKEYVSEFADGESWGYLKYYELALLEEDGYLKDNTVVLKFHVRAPTYYQKYHDQNMYLQKVMKERTALKQQVTSLKSDYKALQSEHRACSQVTSSSQVAPTQHNSHTLSLHMPQHHALSHHGPAHSRIHQDHHTRRERSAATQGSPDKGGSRAVHLAQLHHSSPSHSRSPSHSHTPSHNYTPSHGHTSSGAKSSSYGMQGEGPRLLATIEPSLASSQMLPRLTMQGQSPDFSKIKEKRRKSADAAFLNEQHSSDHHRYIQKQRSKIKSQKNSSPIGEDRESGSSQKWDNGILNPDDIIITVDEEDADKSKSTSSSSTLVEEECSPSETNKKHMSHLSSSVDRHQQEMLQELSQEPFGADDQKEMLSLATLAQDQNTALPLSNYYESYYGEQESFPPIVFRPEYSQGHCPGLSQPNSTTPPKSRHGKSLNDLTNSNGSLSCSQPFLSQSIADFQHMQQRHAESSRHFASGQRCLQGYRGHPPSHMSSDPHLNKSIPGLQRSIIHALTEVREEGETSKRNYSRARKAVGPVHRGNTQSQIHHRAPRNAAPLQNRHVKAMVVQKHSSRRTTQDSPNEKKKEDSLCPLVETEGRIQGDRRSEVRMSWERVTTGGAATKTPDTLAIHHDNDNKDSVTDLHSRQQGHSSHAQTPQSLTSTAKNKSNSTSSLNNLSLIL